MTTSAFRHLSRQRCVKVIVKVIMMVKVIVEVIVKVNSIKNRVWGETNNSFLSIYITLNPKVSRVTKVEYR